MKRLYFVALATAVILGMSTGVAMAAGPWPSNGKANPVAKTITLEYNQPLYAKPVVTGFPTNGYANVWFGGTAEKVTTPARANALLMQKRTSNSSVRVVIPHRDIDASGKLYVRHAVALSEASRTSRTVTVRGSVKPTTKHSVVVKIQRKYMGVWITRQTQTVKTSAAGKFSAKFKARSYKGSFRARVAVAADSKNASKAVYKSIK